VFISRYRNGGKFIWFSMVCLYVCLSLILRKVFGVGWPKIRYWYWPANVDSTCKWTACHLQGRPISSANVDKNNSLEVLAFRCQQRPTARCQLWPGQCPISLILQLDLLQNRGQCWKWQGDLQHCPNSGFDYFLCPPLHTHTHTYKAQDRKRCMCYTDIIKHHILRV